MHRSKKFAAFSAGVLVTVFLFASSAFAASYKVVPNDTLYAISQTFNTTVSGIVQDNSLKNTVIYPGQVLNVPGSSYTVKSGDTLYLISRKFGVSLQNLRKANNKWDDLLYPGQVLTIPAAAVSSGSTPGSTSGNSAGISYTQSDVDLLARLITAEAVGEPYNAQVGVGAVVVNRVKSGEFESSINGVIYQKINGYYQFTPVENGFINKPASADAEKAAIAALNGSDPVGNALFYFDDSSTNSWLWSKPIVAEIGHMVFVD